MNLTTFTFHLSGSASFDVRTLLRNGEPWFVAADVCAALEIANATDALRRLDDDEQALDSIEGISRGNASVNLINESGLYSLVLGSRKPEAKPFKRWVTSEVLPSIRKTGQFSVAPAPAIAALKTYTPAEVADQVAAMKAVMADEELKRLAPLVWQDIVDGVQNAMRAVLGTTLALPGPEVPKPLDVVEIAKRNGLTLPVNLRSAAGKYVKSRSSVEPVVTERLIQGSIRNSYAYTNYAEITSLISAYIASKL